MSGIQPALKNGFIISEPFLSNIERQLTNLVCYVDLQLYFVFYQDQTDPELTCPDDKTLFIPASSNKVELQFTVNCTDNSRENIIPNCSRPESGDYLFLADSPDTVYCTCEDDSGNQDLCNFTVIVNGQFKLLRFSHKILTSLQ